MNRRSLRRAIKAAGGKFLSFADRFRAPAIFGAENVFGLAGLAGIYPTTILSARRENSTSLVHITLGQDVYLGRRVELEAAGNGIEIDEDTSLQDGCAVRGTVRIGAHCLFGHNGLVISTSHRFRDRPEWLIRDQDRRYRQRPFHHEDDDAVQIDDDCWLGWGCMVMPGVHIGRGAILGANSVVTANVGPYEIHGGVPNRKIGERLSFLPPRAISALKDGDLPYFYRGFRHLRKDLETSRRDGVILGRGSAAIILSGSRAAGVVLKGRSLSEKKLQLRFWLNGADLGCRLISAGDFDITLLPSEGEKSRALPARLAAHTVLEWQDDSQKGIVSEIFSDATSRYGISLATLVDAT